MMSILFEKKKKKKEKKKPTERVPVPVPVPEPEASHDEDLLSTIWILRSNTIYQLSDIGTDTDTDTDTEQHIQSNIEPQGERKEGNRS